MTLQIIAFCGRSSLAILILCLSTISCSSTKSMAADNETIISIGSFGGFAGTYKEFNITPSGLLSTKSKLNGDEIQLSNLESKTIEQLTNILEKLSREETEIYSPGNMTYFIKLYQGDDEPVEWVWGGGDQPNNRVQAMYRVLSKLCRAQEHPIR